MGFWKRSRRVIAVARICCEGPILWGNTVLVGKDCNTHVPYST